MPEEVIVFEPVTLGPPFGVWRPISSDIEVMALATDALGTVRVRRRVPVQAGRTWYRVLTRTGGLWCETSSADEARDALAEVGPNGRAESAVHLTAWTEWRPWDGQE